MLTVFAPVFYYSSSRFWGKTGTRNPRSGRSDPVPSGGMAKGVLKTIDAFKRTGLRNITIHIYPEGRHEMLNEVNRSEVYGDVLRWLEAL